MILLDPGHGGKHSGATHSRWTWQGRRTIREADLNLSACHMLAQALIERGKRVEMTRHTDVTLSLGDRCLLEHAWEPECFVSIHCNSFESQAPHGYEIWTSPTQTGADSLATSIFEETMAALPMLKYRRDESDGDPDKEKHLEVLTGTKCPAVLIEMEFLSSPRGRQFLLNPSRVERMMQATANGIVEWGRGR